MQCTFDERAELFWKTLCSREQHDVGIDLSDDEKDGQASTTTVTISGLARFAVEENWCARNLEATLCADICDEVAVMHLQNSNEEGSGTVASGSSSARYTCQDSASLQVAVLRRCADTEVS